MAEKKKAAAAGDAAAAAPDLIGFDLEDLLAVPAVELPIIVGEYEPVPVHFDGAQYAVRRRFTGKQVSAFMRTLRQPRVVADDATGELSVVDVSALVLAEVLADGDPARLGAAIEERSPVEAEALFTGIYKISGLMGATSGKFLAS